MDQRETQERPASQEAQARPESGTYLREGAAFAGSPYISACGLGLKTFAGFAYRDVDVDVHKGELVAVRGRNGSGKTALLLTLAGRMKPTAGTLTVGGFELPRQRSKVERHVGLALFSGLNDLQESLTVLYVLGAEFELYGRKPRRESVTGYLRAWELEDVANVRVKDLTSEKLVQLGIALAFVGEPDASSPCRNPKGSCSCCWTRRARATWQSWWAWWSATWPPWPTPQCTCRRKVNSPCRSRD